MIQFNLLPDVKLEYIKAQRLKHMVIAISVLASAVALIVFLLLLSFVDVAQKKEISDAANSVQTQSVKLTSNANLNKVLTIQNQLNALPQLESQSPAASRVFTYLTELTPAQATISSVNVNFTEDNFSITGSANSLATIDQYVDTLKFTTFKTATTSNVSAFSSVVLSSFGYSTSQTTGQPASFTITFTFDPTIFSNTSPVTLTIPSTTTTRSVQDQPANLFQKIAS